MYKQSKKYFDMDNKELIKLLKENDYNKKKKVLKEINKRLYTKGKSFKFTYRIKKLMKDIQKIININNDDTKKINKSIKNILDDLEYNL